MLSHVGPPPASPHMPLPVGSRLGHYRIVAAVGSGGMGRVFRARDLDLNRDVALKVLLPEVADDPDRLARLTREAQVLASLNHSNIAGIYGFEEDDRLRALVMEYVEGPTLAELIANGPLPLRDALSIASQIADALSSAHEQGVVHRDLKPANIKVRPDGCVKVLDFGLAKALGVPFTDDPTKSPTLSWHTTSAGLILGTAAYMSPEQASGRAVDKRTDLWSFGVVLLEMLTGRPAFTGETVSHVLASVLKTDPDWSALPNDTPEPVRRLLRRCLQKDRKLRLADAGDARIELDDAIERRESSPTQRSRRSSDYLPWAIAAVLAVALAAVSMTRPAFETAAVTTPISVEMKSGAAVALATGTFGSAIALSPDGATLVFVGEASVGNRQLYRRPLQDVVAEPIPGTTGADGPFFSPDGAWVGFFADGKMKKVPVIGGAAVILCDAPNGRGADWSAAQFIVFQPNSTGPLMRVSAAGGAPTPVTALVDGEVTQRWPQLLDNGRAVLFTSNTSRTNWENAAIVVQSLPDGPRIVVHQGGYYARTLASGHLLYLQQGLLFAKRFSEAAPDGAAAPVPALQAALTSTGSGAAHVALSRTGTIAFVPRASTDARVPIVWMDRSGRVSELWNRSVDWRSPQFSPDGRQLAVSVADGQQFDVWVGNWQQPDGLSRLTFEAADDFKPVWSPDGRNLAFASARSGSTNIYLQRADGSTPIQRLTESGNAQLPGSWHPGGEFLAYQENRPESGQDILILPLQRDAARGIKPGTPTAFVGSPFSEIEPMFSPDGRWLAYVANNTGRDEVYVRPFPGPGGVWQVSTGGGTTPTWSRRTHELIYRTPGNLLMSTTYDVVNGVFRPEAARVWSETRIPSRQGPRAFDLHPDGDRVAIAERDTDVNTQRDHITLVTEFFSRLRQLTGAP